jgi:hypothetical protein
VRWQLGVRWRSDGKGRVCREMMQSVHACVCVEVEERRKKGVLGNEGTDAPSKIRN